MPGSDRVLERLKRLHPKVIDLALNRTQRLLAALGHPERRLPPVVHVAGTNGKGSTVAVLRAIVEAAGGSAHVYTSPHLVRFAERIRVAGMIIDDDPLIALLEECEAANRDQPITFFEITTVAALLAFARCPADLCLLETGLGGRFDATNVIERPALTVLSSISLDHQAFLGTTLAAIAFEKAGILKPGVPCIVAAQAPEALAVIVARAVEVGAPLLIEERDWRVAKTASGMTLARGTETIALPPPALPGPHQVHNAGLAAVAALHLGYDTAAIAAGIAGAEWPARLQRLRQGPLVDRLPPGSELWLDGGHNPGAGIALARFVAEAWSERPLHLIVGMLNTKDTLGFLDPLAAHGQHCIAISIPGEPNSLPADAVAEMARRAGLAARTADSLAAAVDDLAALPSLSRILICGSLYLAGTVLRDHG